MRRIDFSNCKILGYNILKLEDDHRIDLFRRFLGLSDLKLRPEVLDQYLILIKSKITFTIGLPISFFKLFEEFPEELFISADICFKLYSSMFGQFNFIFENREKIMNKTIMSIMDREEKVNDKKKFEFFIIFQFYYKSSIFINQIVSNYKKGQTHETFKKFWDQFSISNKDLCISYGEFEYIFEKSFKVSDHGVDLEYFLQFFHERYTFLIKITDFLEISLSSITNTFDLLEKKINRFFSISDIGRHEILSFKEFYDAISRMLTNETKWNISEYLKYNSM